jgi:hypothetical protein
MDSLGIGPARILTLQSGCDVTYWNCVPDFGLRPSSWEVLFSKVHHVRQRGTGKAEPSWQKMAKFCKGSKSCNRKLLKRL